MDMNYEYFDQPFLKLSKQFGTRGSLEQHGFARNKMWLVENDPPALPSFDSTGKAFLDLVLKSSDEDTTRIWPHWYSNCDYFANLFFLISEFLIIVFALVSALSFT